ncbi:DASH family cryptochrome [Dyadobacter tibetensis]|uniref:DASH family cryptochrome n=1 Tax=Dyadobacter tibetensis TaxID=1211851 RepID=UPI0004718EEB|nr:DASH family cryptochrome [Dyadobacter tibetensis]
MRRSIVWFKTDLRVHDNETLIRALEQSDEVIPVFCFDMRQFRLTSYGTQKTGAFRAQFILESVADLEANLRNLGAGLIVARGNPAEVLAKVAREYGAQKIFAKKEVAYEEKRTEDAVEAALWKVGCYLETYSTSTLYHALDLPFAMKDIPDVFTTFRKKIERDTLIRPVFASPIDIPCPALPPASLPTLMQLGLEEPVYDGRGAFRMQGGESPALARVNAYLFETKAILTYKETRNGLLGDNYSSRFSPWLAQGCLSPREIYYAIKEFESTHKANPSTYWLIFELIWRDYFRFMMKKYRNRYFRQEGIKKKAVELFPLDTAIFEKWKNGETGVDFVDANMKELNSTGYMSNRGRQNVASYFCHDLRQDWRYGAAYFEAQLVDYNPCNNWGNWAYVAGVGNDPRPDRAFNIELQAQTYDPDGKYRGLWLQPEDAASDRS